MVPTAYLFSGIHTHWLVCVYLTLPIRQVHKTCLCLQLLAVPGHWAIPHCSFSLGGGGWSLLVITCLPSATPAACLCGVAAPGYSLCTFYSLSRCKSFTACTHAACTLTKLSCTHAHPLPHLSCTPLPLWWADEWSGQEVGRMPGCHCLPPHCTHLHAAHTQYTPVDDHSVHTPRACSNTPSQWLGIPPLHSSYTHLPPFHPTSCSHIPHW